MSQKIFWCRGKPHTSVLRIAECDSRVKVKEKLIVKEVSCFYSLSENFILFYVLLKPSNFFERH